ncbi:putative protein K02A2.6-like [Solea senegalensis]|uniref:CCHC-type domain-containing protein n=1 Tax=Solea senegalensis TaxID=28829 RepID=A0AAV6TAQ9_SOLSE|nr:putative protein K02A2.6-like [Solea senegalensis]
MATIGTLAAFDPKNQTWDEYTEILEQFFAANGIDEAAKQQAILISVVGAATYSLMRNLLSPAKPKDNTFQELVLLMKNHFDPKPSEIVQRYKFDSHSRKPNETVMEYVAELRRLAQDCNYGNTLQQMLKDRIVCGINDDRIQRRLLSDLTFEVCKALSIAVSIETANKNAQDLQTSGATAKCFNLTKGQQETRTFKGESRECYRCKGTKHTAADCKHKQETCHACGKVGHLARACRSKAKLNQKKHGSSNVKSANQRSAHYHSHEVCETEDNSTSDSSEDDSFTLNCVKCQREHKSEQYRLGRRSVGHLRKVDPYIVDMQLDEKNVNFEIDTGCCLTVMNEAPFKATWRHTKLPSLQPIKIKLETYTGGPVKVIGATRVSVRYKQQKRNLPLVVVEGEGPSLLGRGWLEEINLDWREIKNSRKNRKLHHVKTTESTLQQVLSKHEDVFKEELGTLKGMKAAIHVKSDATPRFFRPRSVPFAIRAKVDKEIDRLLKEGIVSPVKYAEWAFKLLC